MDRIRINPSAGYDFSWQKVGDNEWAFFHDGKERGRLKRSKENARRFVFEGHDDGQRTCILRTCGELHEAMRSSESSYSNKIETEWADAQT